MTLEYQILDAVIQDHKERTVLGNTIFGDIFFAEDDGEGTELYSVLQIITRQGVPSNPNAKGKFYFKVKALTQLKKTAKHLIKPSLITPFKMIGSGALSDVYNEINTRYGLKDELTQRLGKLKSNELYGHCYYDDYNSSNDFAEKLIKESYLKEVLAYAIQYPREYYADIYELQVEAEFPPLVQKLYLGCVFAVADEVLLPKFDILKFAENYKKRQIDINAEDYERIPEAEEYFEKLEIPMDLLIDVKELKSDGGDKIYGQLIPFWDGEDDQFDVKSIEDIKYLPNLMATNSMNFSKELIKQLRALKIKVANY